MRRSLVVVAIPVVAALSLACGPPAREPDEHTTIRLAAVGELPAEVRRAPVAVREAYQFAVANPDVLRQVPCYCGCGATGHTSNAACFLAPASGARSPVFDAHALGCSICVDIAQDVMRLMRQDKPLADIRAYVDATYGRYGTSNLR